jgi:aconitate hydratase
VYDIAVADLKPRSMINVRVQPLQGSAYVIEAAVRIDTPEELTAFRHGGILPYVLRQLLEKA